MVALKRAVVFALKRAGYGAKPSPVPLTLDLLVAITMVVAMVWIFVVLLMRPLVALARLVGLWPLPAGMLDLVAIGSTHLVLTPLLERRAGLLHPRKLDVKVGKLGINLPFLAMNPGSHFPLDTLVLAIGEGFGVLGPFVDLSLEGLDDFPKLSGRGFPDLSQDGKFFMMRLLRGRRRNLVGRECVSQVRREVARSHGGR